MATFARARLPDQGAGGVPVNLLGGRLGGARQVKVGEP